MCRHRRPLCVRERANKGMGDTPPAYEGRESAGGDNSRRHPSLTARRELTFSSDRKSETARAWSELKHRSASCARGDPDRADLNEYQSGCRRLKLQISQGGSTGDFTQRGRARHRPAKVPLWGRSLGRRHFLWASRKVISVSRHTTR